MVKSKGKNNTEENAASNGGDGNNVTHGVNAIVTVAIETIKASPNFAVFVFIIVVFSIGPLFFGVTLFLKERFALGVELIAGSYIAILIIGVIIYFLMRPQNQPTGDRHALKIHWSRPMLEMPWKDKLGDYSHLVEAIRNKAYMFLSGATSITGMKGDDIRVNVFLPDYINASEGEVCLLVMEPKLCAGMKGCTDEDLKLRVSQGVTGKVFREQDKQIVAGVLDTIENGGDFHDIYELTTEQKKQIHPDLKWIVSSPLNISYEGVKRAIGVFNVDGLKHEVPADVLDRLAARILPDVMALATELSKHSFVKGLIGLGG
ncbi:MAG: hypothetical protein ACYC43_06230 [Burkholderiales bacterium]